MNASTHAVQAPVFFFFHDTATPEIYTLSLHDALPISLSQWLPAAMGMAAPRMLGVFRGFAVDAIDRKSTRLNSSHLGISYAVFCLKKKMIQRTLENI